jgi:hypothetical protein
MAAGRACLATPSAASPAPPARRAPVNDGTGRRPGFLDDHAPYLRERWNSGCSNATPPWQEIRARGYLGGYGAVEGHVNRIIMWNLNCQVRGIAIARTIPMVGSVAVIGQAVRQWHGQSLGPGPRRGF